MACELCKNEQRLVALEKDSERNQQTHKEFYALHGNSDIARAVSDTKLDQLISAVGKLSAIVDSINKRIEEITLKPAKKWENLSWLLVTGVVSAILGYIISNFTGGG